MTITPLEGDAVEVLAPAKVNLFLEILARRPDGYHELETLMVAVSLCDRLVIRPADAGFRLVGDDPAAGEPRPNLVTRAAQLLASEAGVTAGATFELTKRIPVAAGLAGGSADAAAALIGLNRLWGLNLPTATLAELSSRLGSDIPFFFSLPAAICRGRGERVEPLVPSGPLDLVIVSPRQGLSTAAVYGAIKVPDRPTSVAAMRAAFEAGDVRAVAETLMNRLEEASLSISPVVRAMKADSAGWACEGSLMSGSGSSFFAVCRSPEAAGELAKELSGRLDAAVFAVRTLAS